MQISVIISTILHAALLGWALFSISAPSALEVADVEAVPVAIIPFDDITRVQEGEKDAPAKEKPAAKKTDNQTKVDDAENVGENKIDFSKLKIPVPSQVEVVSKAPPKSASDPKPVVPDQSSQTKIIPEPQPKTAPATEIAAIAKPDTPLEEDPIAQAIETIEPAGQEATKFPENAPIPTLAPKRVKAQTAKSPERKAVKPSVSSAANNTPKSDFNADEIASLLNKQDATGGGAKRSKEVAALGSQSRFNGQLSQSELDALRAQIGNAWSVIPGLVDGEDVRVTITMKLDRSGAIIGQPNVSASGGSDQVRRTLSGSARRAVLRAQPFNLPSEKYEIWSEVIVNFNASELF